MTKRTGSLQDPTFIGQDPARRKAIEERLYSDFGPKDVLEEIWLSEIAALTTTIEYYRELEAATNLEIANRHGLEAALSLENASKSRAVLNAEDGAIKSRAVRLILGQFKPNDVKRIDAIVDMIGKFRRERDRIYLQFERKRRPALLNAVKYTEANEGAARLTDKLSD